MNAGRERQRQRRHAAEPKEVLPSFPEPRKRMERQDSLSNKIQDILGDMGTVHHVIGRDPNVWLGTSRNASTSGNAAKNFSTDKARSYKDGNSKPSSTVSNSHSSRSELSSTVPAKSGYSLSSKSNPVHPHSYKAIDESSASSSSKVGSHNSYSSSAFNSNNLSLKPSSSKQAGDAQDHLGSADIQDSPGTVSNRTRLQSTDMPAAMEKIFREMEINEEPISEIQTPQIIREFNFSKNELKSKSSVNSDIRDDDRNSEALMNSDTDGSDSSDTDESDQEEAGEWSLIGFMTDIQKPTNSIFPSEHEADKKPKENHEKNPAPPQEKTATHKSTVRAQSNNQNSYKDPIPRSRSTAVASSTVKDESKTDKPRPKGRPPAPGRTPSSTHKITSSHPASSQPSKKIKSSNTQPKPNWNSKESSHRGPANTESKSKSGLKTVPVHLQREARQHSKSPCTVQTDGAELTPHSVSNVSSPPLPFSVSNETLSSDVPESSIHHRIGKKAPSSLLASNHSNQTESKDAGNGNTKSDSRVSYSSSDSSDSELSDDKEGDGATSSSESEDFASPSSNSRFATENDQPSWNCNVSKQKKPAPSVVTSQLPSVHKIERNPAVSHKKERIKNRNHKDVKSARPALSRTRSSSPNTIKKPSMHATTMESNSKSSYDKNFAKPPRSVSKPPSSERTHPRKFPSLWAKLPLLSLKRMFSPSKVRIARTPTDLSRDVTSVKAGPRSNERTLQNTRCDSTGFVVSVESSLEPRHRATDEIQVAIAGSSSSVSPTNQARQSPHKRKLSNSTTHSSNSSASSSLSGHKSKRRKSESSSLASNSSGQIQSAQISKAPKKENEQWKDRKEESYSSRQWSRHSDEQLSNQAFTGNKQPKPAASSDSYQSGSHHSGSSASLQEPDSSWPEQETRFKTSEQFMGEGKRLKHEGDSYTDMKTGRTRTGESLSRALLYFEASLCFLMNGFMLELENSSDRGDTPRTSHSPTSMYNQTISLLDYVRKMRPHDEGEGTAFVRLNISCLRTQALLYLRVFKLKKEIANKYHDTISEHFKPNANKSNHAPSPWHGPASQNAVSPVSPAVPSPYGSSLPGPSPLAASNTCEQVSSSTQIGKMTSPPAQNGVLLPPKIHDIFKQYHTIMGNLMLAHDKWDQAESLMSDHTDFFRHVDVLRGHSLNLDNSLKDLATYNKVILRQLRGAYKSPKE